MTSDSHTAEAVAVSPAPAERLRDELERINAGLAAMLHTPPAELAAGSDQAMRDELVVCGILGGKDVGKSTLINALAGQVVSADLAEAGHGTEGPIAYVHEQATAGVQRRLGPAARLATVQLAAHQIDAIRNVVLVDLPDFDSSFDGHAELVASLAPVLDRVLWVQSPRKLGDRAWVRLCGEVVKAVPNVYCVLNKVDELLADERLAGEDPSMAAANAEARAQRFWRAQHAWVSETISAAGYDCPADRQFLMSAAFGPTNSFVEEVGRRWGDSSWSRYADDRPTVEGIAALAREELETLRARVLGPVGVDEIRRAKEANRNAEWAAGIARLRTHYDLDRLLESLDIACGEESLVEAFDESCGPGYVATVAAALERRLRSDEELADELLSMRVQRWPLLRLVYWPLGWLARFGGRRASSRIRPAVSVEEESDAFLVAGRALDARLELARARVLADQAVLVKRLRLEPEFPASQELTANARSAARALVPAVERRMLDELGEPGPRAGKLGRAALWLVLLWFPLLQPMLKGGLEMYLAHTRPSVLRGVYAIVTTLSAGHLLASLGVVALVYVAILAGMHVRAFGAVRRWRQETVIELLTDEVENLLLEKGLAPLLKPFHRCRARLVGLCRPLGFPRDV